MAEKQPESAKTSPHVEAERPTPAAPTLMPARRAPMAPLNEMRFGQREFQQNEWFAIADKGTTIEDLLSRDYWANNAAKLRPKDKIAVMTEDRRMYVELIVFVTGTNWAEVRVLGTPIIVDNLSARSGAASDFDIVDGGLARKWMIVRRSDGRVVKGDGTLQTEDAARAWLREFLQSLGHRAA